MKEAHRTLRNETVFCNALDIQYDDSYSLKGAKSGSPLRIMQPKEFQVGSGKTLVTQNNDEKEVTIDRSVQRHVGFKLSQNELTQDIEEISKTTIQPAMSTLAAVIDNYCWDAAYKEVNNAVTLPVTTVDRLDVLGAGVKLDNFSAPRGSEARRVILNPQGMMDVTDSSSALFNNASSISQQYNDGIIKVPAMGFSFGSSANAPSHTVGLHSTGSTGVTNGVGVEGATTLVTDGWANSTAVLTEGDIFTIASVNSVNPLTKVSTGELQQFVCTAAGTSDGSGNLTVSISPALISTGNYQNIDALPANDAAITVLGTESTAYAQNLAFHKGFGAIGFADLEMPQGAGMAKRLVEDGISMTMVSDFDITNYETIYRIDVLFGYKTVIPRHACRIYGL
jgi:hypothetical protein